MVHCWLLAMLCYAMLSRMVACLQVVAAAKVDRGSAHSHWLVTAYWLLRWILFLISQRRKRDRCLVCCSVRSFS